MAGVRCVKLCTNIVPDIQCWRSVLCWVTINNISLQSKLIFTSEYEHWSVIHSPALTLVILHPEYCDYNCKYHRGVFRVTLVDYD